jgi:hypothetical protein
MKALRTLLSYRLRLLERVALALALVGLAPLGFLAWRLIGITESSLTEQLLRSQAVAARTAAERADAFLSLRRSLADTLSRKVEHSTLPADQVLLAELEALDAIGVLGAALVDPAGVERVRVQLRGASADGVERIAHELRDAGAPALLAGDPPHLLLESKPGERGAVRMLFDAAPLADTLATAEMGRQADLVLVDARRRRLLGPQSGIEGFPDDFLQAATSGRVVQAAQRLIDPAGRSFLGAAAPLSTVPWAIVSRQPTAIAEETVRRMNRAAFASLSGALALIAGLGFLAYRGLVQPIRALAEAQRRVAHAPGDPDQPAGDELHQLTSAFRVLEERLRDREAFDRVFLGRYQVVEILGGGAMGTLFRGWDPRLDRPVAIKTVRFAETDPNQRQQLQQRLLKEAVTTARFSHPNIVSVYDALDAPQGAFVVMEFVDGSSLARLLRDQIRLAPDQVAILGHAVAAGLAAAHEHGVVHRDVTPGNVFLGRAGAIKLGDFGIAEIQALAAPRGGRVFGTPGFIPPEACVGEPFVPAGDVFSLGVVLYLCLTGTHPFLAGGVQQTMLRTVAAEFERPRKLQPAVPAELDDLVVRAMSKHAGQRPRAAELARGLEGLCDALGGVWRMGHLLPQGTEVPDVAAGSTRQWSQTVSTRPTRRG